MDSNAVRQRFKDANLINGTYSRVARSLGVSANHVREVIFGRRTSDRVMRAVVREVARLDKLAARERSA